jgi:hypothetical protein
VSARELLAEVLVGVLVAGDEHRSPCVGESVRRAVELYLESHTELDTPRVRAAIAAQRGCIAPLAGSVPPQEPR